MVIDKEMREACRVRAMIAGVSFEEMMLREFGPGVEISEAINKKTNTNKKIKNSEPDIIKEYGKVKELNKFMFLHEYLELPIVFGEHIFNENKIRWNIPERTEIYEMRIVTSTAKAARIEELLGFNKRDCKNGEIRFLEIVTDKECILDKFRVAGYVVFFEDANGKITYRTAIKNELAEMKVNIRQVVENVRIIVERLIHAK